MNSFWHKLAKKKKGKPILALAPMADVTDSAFRRVIAKYGKPDVIWTEFVSADGLCSSGKEKLLHNLVFSSKEKPVVAQLFGSNPENMKKASALVASLGFQGIDINMGCPDKKVEKQGAGAGHIKDPKKAVEIIRAAKAGAPNLPISVKTRLGYNKDELETWLPILLAEKPAVVTVHARTRKEMSLVPARWERVKRAVEIRDALGVDTLIFGNGDVIDVEDAEKKARETGAGGVMIGRGIFGNPWLFSNRYPKHILDIKNKKDKEWIIQKLKVLLEHTKLFEKLLSEHKSFAVMKKHYKAYVSGWAGAKELRIGLMNTKDYKEVGVIVKEYISSIDKS